MKVYFNSPVKLYQIQRKYLPWKFGKNNQLCELSEYHIKDEDLDKVKLDGLTFLAIFI